MEAPKGMVAKKLIQWMESVHKDKLKWNPKVVEVRETVILFGMEKHQSIFVIPMGTISKENILDLKIL